MAQYAELILGDSTVVRLQLSPVGVQQAEEGNGAHEEFGELMGYAELNEDDEDLPDGIGGAEPVGRVKDAARVVLRGSLRGALRPLGPLLREVHSVVTSVDSPPQEFNVQFGLQLGQDLKLGIVDVKSASSITVSATWRPVPETGTGS
ncbi:CU044_2847 family protein [Streptomyces sp. NPDC002402]